MTTNYKLKLTTPEDTDRLLDLMSKFNTESKEDQRHVTSMRELIEGTGKITLYVTREYKTQAEQEEEEAA